jgi:hypothetical protein
LDDFLNKDSSKSSIEESDNLSSDVSLSAFLVGEDSFSCWEDKMAELSGGKNVVGPLFEVGEEDIVSGRYNSTFVDSSNKFDNNLFASVIINDLKLTDVVVLLHDAEEFDKNLWNRLQKNLLLSFSLSVDNSSKSIRQYVDLYHFVDNK